MPLGIKRDIRKRVLVTDGDARAALAITRSLGRRGLTVLVSAARRNSLAGTSRYSSGEFQQADVKEGPDALRHSLLKLASDLDPDLIVGVTDRSLHVLLEAHDELPPRLLAPPSSQQYYRGSDKVQLFQTCQSLGITAPRGHVIDGGELPDPDMLQSLGSPVVVRPALSWRAVDGRWVHGQVTFESNREDIHSRLRRDEALQFPYLVQERLAGDGCGMFVLAEAGRVTAVFSHRRLREKPPSGGVSTLCESVAPSPEMLQAASRYVTAEGWSGLAMFEFKRSEITGQAHLLEINARPWGSMALADAVGMDFIGGLIALTEDRPWSAMQDYPVGVRLRWWWGDVDHFYLKEMASGSKRIPALISALGQALTCGPRAEAWDTFQLDDPIPFGFETLAWLRR